MRRSIVVIGTSRGGLQALRTLLAGLPRAFPVPVVIVQHRGNTPDEALCDLLQERSVLPIAEAEDKQALLPGHVYLAPEDYHLLIDNGCVALSTAAPLAYSRPSIDVLFDSAAVAYGPGVIGVILTGSNRDGAAGAVRIKEQGGVVVAEDPATAASNAMPAAAIAAAAVDRVLPLDEIAAFLLAACAGGSRHE